MSSYELPATVAKPPAHMAIAVRRNLSTRWVSVLTLAALLTLWWAVTATGLIEPLFLPPPSAVLQKGWLLATTGYMDATLWQHLGASLNRIGLGLGFAVLTAVPVGIAIGSNRIARGILDPLIEFYRPIPPLAYLPLIVIWCGIGELSKVLLIYLAIFAPIAIATATGVRTVDPAKLRAAQSLGASRAQLIRHVILPSALPDILTGVRIGLGVGWSTLVAAELIAATSGLGFMVQSAAQFLVTDVVVLGILVIALIAFAMEMSLRALQRKLVPWHGQAH
ncbi:MULTISPECIES: taurine ABC transporter permease TauC [Pseudomonas]|jgi:taurine transport system permease protein|uniref:Taurine ABC transporter permease TauC n=2 Tax=Pseudomonas TaxID=286 RepID=A0A4Y9T9B9_PSEFL|nr:MULTISPECIES: taurine ABC transporter permease TauC [Pseudomonas]CRM94649.1 Putative aliphatic sulfonates transport permease protein SsuC [Pseudomonas sp. 22 E 5]MCX9153204.1 taurine ABC transporter permease TauC [Pseudomonas sp. TB1-B1]QXH67734.1 taurine ABC transporter permease TauC [Pseudomonas asgharzadehiana]TFW40691.1 taurine ABC transporter permease TauC [Pseudomonas fluorescens]TKJ57582.1 taurine ABC transporter permease TauC [Pseudomonas sp. CFBP13506]